MRINEIQSCLSTLIGVRHVCNSADAEVYIDDLPGINLINANDAADGDVQSGKELFERCINLASKLVPEDFVSVLRKNHNVRSVLRDYSIRWSGNDTYYGEKEEWLSIKVNRLGIDKFQGVQLTRLGIVSDRVVVGKEFHVATSKDTYTQKFNLKQGFNRIDIEIKTDADEIRIYWDVCNFKVGKRTDYYNYCGGCYSGCNCYSPDFYGLRVDCEIGTSGESAIDWVSSNVFGFDIDIQRYCDENLLACYYRNDLRTSMLYKSGINFCQEVKGSERINSYTRNSTQKIENLLLWWNGGHDYATGINHKSEYWRYLVNAAEQVRYDIQNMSDSECFVSTGNRITSQLP